jgi:hypothetical protein
MEVETSSEPRFNATAHSFESERGAES